jgi:ribosome-associated protein
VNEKTEDLEPISKTKLKAEADAAQDIGKKLIDLPKDRLIKLRPYQKPYSMRLRRLKRLTANGAIRRQKQYIGRLMRDIDIAPIVDQLQRWEGKHNEESAKFHTLERWRERLLKDESAVSEYIAANPQVDSQQLRTLIRNAQREEAAQKPPKSSRELFKLLREIAESIEKDDMVDD